MSAWFWASLSSPRSLTLFSRCYVEDFDLSRLQPPRIRFLVFFPLFSLPPPVSISRSLPLTSSCHLVRLLSVPVLKRYKWPPERHIYENEKLFRCTYNGDRPLFRPDPLSIASSLCVNALSRTVPTLPSVFCTLLSHCLPLHHYSVVIAAYLDHNRAKSVLTFRPPGFLNPNSWIVLS